MTPVDPWPEPTTHEHTRRLVAVHLEDGATVREHVCETCGEVWFS